MASLDSKLRAFVETQVNLREVDFVYLFQTPDRKIRVYLDELTGIFETEKLPGSILWKVPAKTLLVPYCAWTDLNYESYWDLTQAFALVGGRTKILG